MSDRPIQVGDLVQVVRSHCPGFEAEAGGVVFTVVRLRPVPRPMCTRCGSFLTSGTVVAEGGKDWRIPLQFLKRIPPIGDLEGTSEDARRPTPEEFSRRVDEMQIDMVKLARNLAGIK